MSNWASVIICFSGIDEAVIPSLYEREHVKQAVDDRLEAIRKAFNADPYDGGLTSAWVVAYPCPSPAAVGKACEVVAVTHCNHFRADYMQRVLAALEWDIRDEVTLLWKTEDDSEYQGDGIT
jgi:hypothetical protein